MSSNSGIRTCSNARFTFTESNREQEAETTYIDTEQRSRTVHQIVTQDEARFSRSFTSTSLIRQHGTGSLQDLVSRANSALTSLIKTLYRTLGQSLARLLDSRDGCDWVMGKKMKTWPHIFKQKGFQDLTKNALREVAAQMVPSGRESTATS